MPAADRDRLAAQRRIVALFDRRVKGIHVDMDDLPSLPPFRESGFVARRILSYIGRQFRKRMATSRAPSLKSLWADLLFFALHRASQSA